MGQILPDFWICLNDLHLCWDAQWAFIEQQSWTAQEILACRARAFHASDGAAASFPEPSLVSPTSLWAQMLTLRGVGLCSPVSV